MSNDSDQQRLCVIFTSWPADRSVTPVVAALLEARLAACVHVGPPGTSTYRWQGAIETAEERPVTIKTTRQRLAAVEASVRAHHPYEVPEWLVVDVDGSDAYVAWTTESVAAAPSSADAGRERSS